MFRQILYWYLRLAFLTVSIAACAPTLERTQAAPLLPTPTATRPVCQPSTIRTSNITFPEIRATMHSEGEAWALLFFDQAHAKQDLKIVWRVTGTGTQAQAQAKSEDGTVLQPIWGPELHSGSNWNHPGSEWGTGFNLPEAGCWTLIIKQGDTQAAISINVVEP